MGFPQPVAFKLFASLLPTAISERRADFNTPRKSTNPLKTKAYEKTNNINRYRQYRCGPGINIRMRDYQRRRGCSKPTGSSRRSTRPTARPWSRWIRTHTTGISGYNEFLAVDRSEFQFVVSEWGCCRCRT